MHSAQTLCAILGGEQRETSALRDNAAMPREELVPLAVAQGGGANSRNLVVVTLNPTLEVDPLRSMPGSSDKLRAASTTSARAECMRSQASPIA